MRVLVSSTPEQSHLAPQMPLALELQHRGHEVLVACGATLGEYAQRIGIPTVAAGVDLDLDRPFGDRDLMPPPNTSPEELDRLARRVFVDTYAMALVGDLRRIAEEWRPHVMMRDRSEYARGRWATRSGYRW
jgi:UDP:flavonoid glycosyltransferase YjiC (YdhE family)